MLVLFYRFDTGVLLGCYKLAKGMTEECYCMSQAGHRVWYRSVTSMTQELYLDATVLSPP